MRLPPLHRPHRQPTVILVVVAAVAVTVADGDNHAMHDVDGGTMRPGNSSSNGRVAGSGVLGSGSAEAAACCQRP